MSALCKIGGWLCLMGTAPAKSPEGGHCPICGGQRFQAGTGWASEWTECATDECDFAVLTTHLDRAPDFPADYEEKSEEGA